MQWMPCRIINPGRRNCIGQYACIASLVWHHAPRRKPKPVTTKLTGTGTDSSPFSLSSLSLSYQHILFSSSLFPINIHSQLLPTSPPSFPQTSDVTCSHNIPGLICYSPQTTAIYPARRRTLSIILLPQTPFSTPDQTSRKSTWPRSTSPPASWS